MTTPTPPAAAAALPPSSRHLGPGRARLTPYALWQLRDYFTGKGIGTMVIVALLLFLAWLPFRAVRAGGATPEQLARLAEPVLTQILMNFVLFGILFATNGIVAEDRKLGYYRFYFSKPVSVVAFYAQKFAVHLVGFLLIAALMLGAFALLVHPIYPPAYFPVLALLFVGLGGIGFMLSAVTTADWVSLVGAYVISLLAWTLYGTEPGWRGALVRLLPPVHKLGAIYEATIAAEPVPMKWIWWIAAYGAACAILGLVVLTRRRLATT